MLQRSLPSLGLSAPAVIHDVGQRRGGRMQLSGLQLCDSIMSQSDDVEPHLREDLEPFNHFLVTRGNALFGEEVGVGGC